MKITELTHIGLSEKEAKIYLATLELGFASVQGIAHKAGTNRVAVYALLETLKTKGLINTTYKGKRKVYVATRPVKLLNVLKEKHGEVQNEIINFKEEMLPELMSIYNKGEDKPKIQYYNIKEGVDIYFNDLEKSKEKYIYGLNSWENQPRKYRTPKQQLDRLKRMKKQFKHTCIYRQSRAEDLERMKIFPQATFISKSRTKGYPISSSIFAFDKKVYIMHFIGEPFVLIIKNESIFNAIKFMSIATSTLYKMKQNQK